MIGKNRVKKMENCLVTICVISIYMASAFTCEEAVPMWVSTVMLVLADITLLILCEKRKR